MKRPRRDSTKKVNYSEMERKYDNEDFEPPPRRPRAKTVGAVPGRSGSAPPANVLQYIPVKPPSAPSGPMAGWFECRTSTKTVTGRTRPQGD